uniref:PR domain zinc finger protein 8 n=1 Tax=Monodelphis domestica TaxID=13616 RepID=F6WMS6_MONDO
MDLRPLPKLLWTNDSKQLHHHFPDVFATVHTTQDIPEEATFGPCMLQNTFLDTIAFIALKCLDRRNIHYVFKVDVNSIHSPTGLTWMRLVQAACSSKEQNLEAYLENSQLYFRPTRKISQNEELFVWYDEELSCLLGFQDIKAKALHKDYRCLECNQTFKCEHSYLSHIRFLCSPGKVPLVMSSPDAKAPHSRDLDQSTNFHNLARDLEVKMSTQKEGPLHSPLPEKGLQTNEAEPSQVQKMVLLGKTNHLSKGVPSVPCSRDGGAEHVLSAAIWKLNPVKQSSKKTPWVQKPSAFTEVKRLNDKLQSERAREEDQGNGSDQLGKEQQPMDCVLSGTSSAFSFVWPARAFGELGSAFSKPVKCLAHRTALNSQIPVSNSAEALGDLSGFINTMDAMCCGNLLNSKFSISDLCNLQMLQEWTPQCHTFPYASELWPKPVAQFHISPSSSTSSVSSGPSLMLLPPTFTSLGMATQNWCAKCNLSFRMTSDLVFHMRSHHKKEYSSSEVQAKRRREEKLTCPICHEYFRERHHLSRHMTSHN